MTVKTKYVYFFGTKSPQSGFASNYNFLSYAIFSFKVFYRIAYICHLLPNLHYLYISICVCITSIRFVLMTYNFCLILMPEKFCSFRHIEAHKCNFILLLHFIYILYIFIYLGIHNYNLTTFYI